MRAFILILFLASGVLSASWISSGTVWYDTDGKKIDAHGGGVIKRGDTFYWVGHSAENGQLPDVHIFRVGDD